MPQMSPINWLLMANFCFLLLFMMKVYFYYIFKLSLKKNIKNKYMVNSWKW